MDRGIYVPEHAAINIPRAGQKWRPSNGHEGELFDRHYCMGCSKDQDGTCRIFMLTLVHALKDPEYPSEWQYGRDGQPTCTAFDDAQAQAKGE